MNKSKLLNYVIITLGVLIITSIGLIVFLLLNPITKNNVINVSLESNDQEIIEFNSLNIAPGFEDSYIINLHPEVSGNYDLSFEFIEKDDLELKNYIYIIIVIDDKIICDKLLANLFDENIIYYNTALTLNKTKEITVIYYMPLEVGNEAMNTKISFDVVINANIN